MKQLKRVVSLLLVLIMSLGVFTACGNKSNKKSGERVLTVGIPQDATIPDYETNALTRWLEEQTGIEIEWVFFASGTSDYAKQLTLMCSANEELPDVLLGFNGLGHYTINQLGEEGFIIDLSKLIEKNAPNYQKALSGLDKETQQYIKEKGTNTVDGKSFYALPSLEMKYADNLQTMAYINQTWLTKLGLQVPTTTAELVNVCKAFATQDPNGNGQQDEMAMMGDFSAYLMNAFVEYDSGNFNVKDGKVWDPVYTDEWRKGMSFIADLVKNDYYNKLSFTLTNIERKNLVSAVDGTMKVGMFAGHHEIMTHATSDVLSNYVAMGPLADETGKGGYTIINEIDARWGACITEDCENPELAMEFLDTFYMDEAITRQRHGEKDVDWEYKEGTNVQGTASYTKPLNMAAFIDKNQNCTLGNLLYIMTDWNYLIIDEDTAEGRVADAARLQKEQWAVMNAAKEREIVGRLVYTTEEYEAREEKAGEVSSYISEQTVLFATGEKDINNDSVWAEFKSTLTSLGRQDLMKIAQDAYSRKTK